MVITTVALRSFGTGLGVGLLFSSQRLPNVSKRSTQSHLTIYPKPLPTVHFMPAKRRGLIAVFIPHTLAEDSKGKHLDTPVLLRVTQCHLRQ